MLTSESDLIIVYLGNPIYQLFISDIKDVFGELQSFAQELQNRAVWILLNISVDV